MADGTATGPDQPPATPPNTLQCHVSYLRQQLRLRAWRALIETRLALGEIGARSQNGALARIT
jgi:hypothetical protein